MKLKSEKMQLKNVIKKVIDTEHFYLYIINAIKRIC